MTIGGWIIMVISVLGVIAFFGLCIWQVLSTPGSTEHLHGFEAETPDHDT